MSQQRGDKRKGFSKEEYSEVFNAVFGTNIDWTKLSKEELMELAIVLNHPEIFLSNLGIESDKILQYLPRGSLLKAAAKILKKYGFRGPVVELLEELTSEKK